MKIVESKTLDSTIANFIYENALSFHVADTQISPLLLISALNYAEHNAAHVGDCVTQ
jgi:hypothetical protein